MTHFIGRFGSASLLIGFLTSCTDKIELGEIHSFQQETHEIDVNVKKSTLVWRLGIGVRASADSTVSKASLVVRIVDTSGKGLSAHPWNKPRIDIPTGEPTTVYSGTIYGWANSGGLMLGSSGDRLMCKILITSDYGRSLERPLRVWLFTQDAL